MAIHLRIVALAAAACLGMANLATPARAAEIVVVCSGAMTEILGELAPMFERATGHKVVRTFHPKGVVAAEIRSDMQVDLLLTNPDLIEDLVKEGKVVAVSGQNFVQSFAGVAVRAGAPKPDVSTVEGFKNAMLAAKTVSYSVGPSGLALVKMLERLGIGDQVKAKAVVVKPGERVGEYVAQGRAEIGIQQLTELLPISGLEVVGRLPKELQEEIIYSTATPTTAKQTEAAKVFVAYLRSEAVVPGIKKMGLELLR